MLQSDDFCRCDVNNRPSLSPEGSGSLHASDSVGGGASPGSIHGGSTPVDQHSSPPALDYRAITPNEEVPSRGGGLKVNAAVCCVLCAVCCVLCRVAHYALHSITQHSQRVSCRVVS